MAIDTSYLVIIAAFLIYYILVLFLEKRIIRDPGEIIEKFLSTVLLYAGISLIYFSLTGEPLLGESPQTYSIYIFIIGFIAVLWTIPNLMEDFSFFRKFLKKEKKK
tara:strand:- start:217 stop:534 length:318 start_codon:yes stop_codon:yes gene_type:complete